MCEGFIHCKDSAGPLVHPRTGTRAAHEVPLEYGNATPHDRVLCGKERRARA
jgi:hypothetical protein